MDTNGHEPAQTERTREQASARKHTWTDRQTDKHRAYTHASIHAHRPFWQPLSQPSFRPGFSYLHAANKWAGSKSNHGRGQARTRANHVRERRAGGESADTDIKDARVRMLLSACTHACACECVRVRVHACGREEIGRYILIMCAVWGCVRACERASVHQSVRQSPRGMWRVHERHTKPADSTRTRVCTQNRPSAIWNPLTVLCVCVCACSTSRTK